MPPETLILLKETGAMFVYLFTQLTFLFLLISYLVGVLQHYIPPEKIRNILSARNGKGYVVAAALGAITHFALAPRFHF